MPLYYARVGRVSGVEFRVVLGVCTCERFYGDFLVWMWAVREFLGDGLGNGWACWNGRR